MVVVGGMAALTKMINEDLRKNEKGERKKGKREKLQKTGLKALKLQHFGLLTQEIFAENSFYLEYPFYILGYREYMLQITQPS